MVGSGGTGAHAGSAGNAGTAGSAGTGGSVPTGGSAGSSGSGASAPFGTCSVSGTACDVDSDCPDLPITGHCLLRKDAGGSACVYDAQYSTGSTVTCEGASYVQCHYDSDCFTNVCGSFASNWCGTDVKGLCMYGEQGGKLGTPAGCVVDHDCTLHETQICVF